MKDRTEQYRSTPREDIPLNWRPGQVIAGLYKVEDTTSGGMGAVYFVKHLNWNIPLAVKTPLPDMVKNKTAMDRFIRESETWVDLGVHPHIAGCYYVRVLGGLPRIFIEYVDGGNLKEWLREERSKGLTQVLDIAIQIARGMDYVHEKGVIHRDLKPANCLLTKDGLVKITDFGLVKAGDEIEEISGIKSKKAEEGSITLTGSGFGTLEYMPPEQFIDAKHVGNASDIYSFGVMLFEMVCGRRPFIVSKEKAPVAREYFYQKAHQEETPPEPANLQKGCSRALNDLILSCLDKSPGKRPQSFNNIEENLLEVYEQASKKAYPRKRPDPLRLKADALNNRAASLLDLGRQQEAQQFWQEALKTDPANLGANFNLGYYRWKKGEIDFYSDCYLGVLKGLGGIHERDPEYWYNLAVVEAEVGLLDKAKESVKKAIDLGYKANGTEDILALPSTYVRIFEGHTNIVNSVALSPNGRYALSGSGGSYRSENSDNTLRLWDIETGECLRVFEGHTEQVNSVALSPNGRYALSGSGGSYRSENSDNTLRLWDIETGEFIQVFEGHTGEVTSVAISMHGKYALSAGNSFHDALMLWDIETGEFIRVFEGHTGEVTSVALSPDGKYALSGSYDKTLWLWDLQTGESLRVFRGHSDLVVTVALTPNGRHALSGSSDKTLRLWDIETGECLRVFAGHSSSVTSIALSLDGRHALSGSWDESLRLWDIETGECLRIFEGHTRGVTSVALSPDGKYALSGSDDQTLRLWRISNLPVLFKNIISRPSSSDLAQEEQEIIELSIARASSLMDAGQQRKAYNLLQETRKLPGAIRDQRILDLINDCGLRAGYRKGLSSYWQLQILKGHTREVTSIALSPDGRHALSGSGSGDESVRLWDIETGECLRVHEPPVITDVLSVESVAVSGDGRYALAARGNKDLYLWDIETGTLLQLFGELKGHTGWVTSVALSSDGRHALSGSRDFKSEGPDTTLKLWDTNIGECLRVFQGHTDDVTSAAISPDGRYALSGSRDKTLRLWDIETGKCPRVFKGHTDSVNSAALCPDGKYALSGSLDNTMRLWDIETGECLRVFEGHTRAVTSVALSPDGKYALSGSVDRTLRLWDIKTGESLCIFEGHSGGVTSVALGRGGRYALSGGMDKTVRLWELDWEWEFPEEKPAADKKKQPLEPKSINMKQKEDKIFSNTSLISRFKNIFKRSQ